jgi:hypothetical protein
MSVQCSSLTNYTIISSRTRRLQLPLGYFTSWVNEQFICSCMYLHFTTQMRMFRFCTQCLGKAETADIKTTSKSMLLLYLTSRTLRHVKERESKGTPPCILNPEVDISVTSWPLVLRGRKPGIHRTRGEDNIDRYRYIC